MTHTGRDCPKFIAPPSLLFPTYFMIKKARESWAHGLTPEGYKHSADDGEIFFIAIDDQGQPIGFAGYRGYEMTALFVAPAFQNRGVATALFNKILVEILKGAPRK